MKKSFLFLSVILLFACADEPLPKPMGYFRIGLPEKHYQALGSLNCPYTFQKNTQAELVLKENCWADLEYKSIRATIKLTYYNFDDKPLTQLIADGQRMAYSHTKVAEGLKEQLILNPEKRVFGMMYQMRGQVATSTQFFVTDSTDNFLRGVLYFYSQPNPDSLKPVNDFMFDEITRLVETVEWKN